MDDWRQKTLASEILRVPVNVLELVSDSVSALMFSEDVALNVAIDDLVVNLDYVSMVRVVTNLVKNAVEAMPDGGTLSVKGCVMDGALSLVVADTGLGMSDETLGNLFTPFYTTKETGTGLGLAYCRQAVEAHGGTIAVKSVVDEGTIFTISIPTVEESD